jgi:hydroxymethylglutaryl-CoA reductase
MKLEQVKQVREAASVGVRDGNMIFRCSAWDDAMGTNMVLKGMHNVLDFLHDHFPNMDTISISGWLALLLFG